MSLGTKPHWWAASRVGPCLIGEFMKTGLFLAQVFALSATAMLLNARAQTFSTPAYNGSGAAVNNYTNYQVSTNLNNSLGQNLGTSLGTSLGTNNGTVARGGTTALGQPATALGQPTTAIGQPG